MKKITIVLPTLNEEHGIGGTIDAIPIPLLRKMGYETEILIVDGNSIDRTAEIARSKGARIVIEKRKGYGRAYKTGFERSSGDIIVTADADMTYPMDHIPELLDTLENKKLDFITTNRFGRMEGDAMKFSHKMGNITLSFFFRMLFRIKVKDSQSGMWVFRKKILESLKLESDGMPFSEEIKIEAWRYGQCLEVPIAYKERAGVVKLNTFRDGIKNLIFLFRKRINN